MANRIVGDRELQAKLRRLSDLSFLKPVLQAESQEVKGYIAQYPPASSANTPDGPGSRWYERGYGPRWMRADGSMGGRKTSETLGKSWSTKGMAGGLRQVIGNDASYGPFVQSEEKQARFHKRRGWRTDADAVREKSEGVLRAVQGAVDRELAK